MWGEAGAPDSKGLRAGGNRPEVSPMARVLLEMEAGLCLGPQCLVWGPARGTWLLTQGSGSGAGRSPGAGRQQEVEQRPAGQLGHGPWGREGRARLELGPAWAELKGAGVGARREEAGVRAGAEGGTRTRAGGEAAGVPGEPWRGRAAGGDRAPLPLLSVTVAASGRCRPGPLREDPSLSLSHPHPHLAGVGSPGGAGKGLAGPAHLTQLSRPGGSSLPPPHPSQASEPREAPQA